MGGLHESEVRGHDGKDSGERTLAAQGEVPVGNEPAVFREPPHTYPLGKCIPEHMARLVDFHTLFFPHRSWNPHVRAEPPVQSPFIGDGNTTEAQFSHNSAQPTRA